VLDWILGTCLTLLLTIYLSRGLFGAEELFYKGFCRHVSPYASFISQSRGVYLGEELC
jgi:hypothetical protein